MKFEGSFDVEHPPEAVWPYLTDPAVLEECAPGCKEIVLESPSAFRTTVEVGVGSVKPTFDVDAVVTACERPERLALTATGEATRNAFSVTATQELRDNGDGTTTVTWTADAEVSGVIASLGERALESVTDRLVGEFFANVEERIESGAPAEATFEAADETEIAAAEAARRAPSSAGPSPVAIAAGAVIGALAGLLWARARGDGGGTVGPVLIGALAGALAAVLRERWATEPRSRATPDSDPRQPAETDVDGTGGERDGRSPPAVAGGAADGDEAPERGLIEDPLDRLE